MRTSCNPGRLLVLEGSLRVEHGFVVDQETGREVTLATMLQAFLEDPDSGATGPIEITIQPAQKERISDYCPWYLQ